MRPRPGKVGKTFGLALVEVLVACSLLGGLSVLFLLIFGQVRGGTDSGSARIALRAIHRETQQRLNLVLRSAIAPNEVDPAVLEPLYSEESSVLRFHAPVDLIDSTLSFDPRTPDYPEFTIFRSGDSGGLVLRRSDGVGGSQLIGRQFSRLNFSRELKRLITVTLVSQSSVRGTAGSRKTIVEESQNAIMIPGIR